ncbi:MAG: YMGG-like glycine zipper-containing protein [Gammaproteobacteria bacterium]
MAYGIENTPYRIVPAGEENDMKKISIIIAYAVLSCSCASQNQQAKTEGTAVGAIAGAALGGLAGWAIGGDAKGAAIGAGVGALLGGAGGYSYADNLVAGDTNISAGQPDIAIELVLPFDHGRTRPFQATTCRPV